MRDYPRLDRWARREQERFDRQRANPPTPGAEPFFQRALVATFAVIGMTGKLVVFPLLAVSIARLIVKGSIQSITLAIALLALLGFSIFTTTYLIRARRDQGRNWLTGLSPRVSSR